MNLSESQTVYVYFWDSWRETPTRLYDLRLLLGVLVCMLLNCIWEDIIRTFLLRKVSVCILVRQLERDTYQAVWSEAVVGSMHVVELYMRRHYQTFSLEKSQTVYVYFWDSWRETPTRLYDLRLLLGVCMLLNCIWEDIIRLFSWERLKKHSLTRTMPQLYVIKDLNGNLEIDTEGKLRDVEVKIHLIGWSGRMHRWGMKGCV